MRKMYLLPMMFLGIVSYGQVGINSIIPKSTLDVVSKTSDGTASEGFIVPRITGNTLKAAETTGVYSDDQDATLVYVTSAPDPENRTGQVEGMDARGFYYFDAGSNRWVKMISSGTSTAALTQLVCSASTTIGVLEATSPASGVSVTIPYNGGNGGVYSGLSIPSVGILNLNAELASGTLNNGNGTLVFNITGTPSAPGTATFNIDLGGETCGFSIPVEPSSNFADVVDVLINGQTRQMMTRNLGADPTKDPGILIQAIMGSYYQWGKKNPVATAYIGSGNISGWSTSYAADKSWNSGTAAAPVKTSKDPCPDGFRIPTRNEWLGFYNASTDSNIGTWATTTTGGATNFSVAKVFVNNGKTLYFPGGGQRHYSAGDLRNRAVAGTYWSSTENGSGNGYSLTFLVGSVNPENNNTNRNNGFLVRCISQ